MRVLWIAAIALFTSVLPGWAGDLEEREKLAGMWQERGADGHTWTIREGEDDITLTETVKGEKVLEVACNTLGRECELSQDKHAKVSLWFNGPRLVAMETRGKDVRKRRFQIAADGNTLRMELIPIAPAGKTETVEFTRMARE